MRPAKPKPLTWAELQPQLLATTSESKLLMMLKEERQGLNRAQWILRIYGRYSTVREARERRELL